LSVDNRVISFKKKVAIIGGSGYIGSSLARYFSKDFDVRVVDNHSLPDNLKGKVDYYCCDVRDFGDVVSGLDDVDLVINTAIVQIPLINEQKRLGYEVNVSGTQNVCRAVEESETVKGLILSGTWHVIGERGLRGLINEEFGFRPDKVEQRARLYTMCKIIQETIVRYYDEMSSKVFGVLRLGTVLGEGMPEKTAANLFIEKGLKSEPITPFSHSMYRPMLYVDVDDVGEAFARFSKKILTGEMGNASDSSMHVLNVYHPVPITILDLAKIIEANVKAVTNGKQNPRIEIKNTHPPILFSEEDKKQINVDMSKTYNFLKIEKMIDPEESIRKIIQQRVIKSK
jgi:nucleoside-diphosphate-sugar epimerase